MSKKEQEKVEDAHCQSRQKAKGENLKQTRREKEEHVLQTESTNGNWGFCESGIAHYCHEPGTV